MSQKIHSQCIRADSRIRLQWCQEITVHECAKIASTKTTEVDSNIKCLYQILAYIYWIYSDLLDISTSYLSKYCLILSYKA